MYDENKWNEVNNENEKKNNEQPVNTQNTQNTQNGAQQPQGEHTGRQVYGRLGSGTQNGQPYNGNPNGQNGYYGGQQHQQYYGNQNQYTNPYQQYDYYQGHGQNPNGNGNSHHASKKHSYAKTTGSAPLRCRIRRNDVRSQPCGQHPVAVPEFPAKRLLRDHRADDPDPGSEHIHNFQQRCCY